MLTALAGNLTGADPRFVNAAAGNFRLAIASPAIDRGVPLAEVAADADGARRPVGQGYDAGAYEYGGVAEPERPRNVRVQPY